MYYTTQCNGFQLAYMEKILGKYNKIINLGVDKLIYSRYLIDISIRYIAIIDKPAQLPKSICMVYLYKERTIMKNSGNKTKFLILGLLSEEPLSGYEIKKIVDMRFSFFWNESFGQIYPQLKKLNEEGIIKEESSKESENGKAIRKYAITDSGINELKEWLKEPVEKEVVRYEILLKLYFSNIVSPEVMLEHIKEFQRTHSQQMKLFEKFRQNLEEYKDVHSNHRDILMVLSFGEKVWKAYDEWCEEVSKVLEKEIEGGD